MRIIEIVGQTLMVFLQMLGVLVLLVAVIYGFYVGQGIEVLVIIACSGLIGWLLLNY